MVGTRFKPRCVVALWAFFATALAVLGLGGCGSSGAEPLADAGQVVSGVSSTPDNPLKLLDQQQLEPQYYELTFSTPAMPPPGDLQEKALGAAKVRVWLPKDYLQSSARYRVLYLLNGATGSYKDYQADIEANCKDLPLIVVVPDGGPVGEFSDWYNNGLYGIPMYETFHIDQLIPWIDAHFRTKADREGRGVAGVSMGGFGAMSYAARHPDLFVSATAFSGAVDTGFPLETAVTPPPVWGERASQEVRWRGSNPVDLAMNLRDIDLVMRTGNGMIGTDSYGVDQQVFDPVEFTVHQDSVDLHDALNSFGIPHFWEDYGPGGHAEIYWARDFKLTMPQIMQTFAHPPLRPSSVTYTSIANDYSVYGWRVSLERPALEFSTLKDASRSGFTLLGSGTATVLTPAFYEPNATYGITQVTGGQHRSSVVHPDAGGRLKLPIELGPANAFQQFTAAALATGTAVYDTTVAIAKN
jgi:S-formylglutathione hydrolase FrmB